MKIESSATANIINAIAMRGKSARTNAKTNGNTVAKNVYNILIIIKLKVEIFSFLNSFFLISLNEAKVNA